MPPKRVAVAEPEVSPDPKRRAKSTQRKRKDEESTGEEIAKKGRRKKTEEEDEEEVAVTTSETAAVVVSSPSAAITPAKKARRKSIDTETATKAPRSTKKPVAAATTVALASPEKPVTVATPKSTKKVVSTPKAVTPRVILPPIPLPYAPKVTPVKAAIEAPVQQHHHTARGQEGLVDEHEILSVWDQAVNALQIAGNFIVPVFLSIVLFFYVNGKLNQDQAIASIGIVFAMFLVLIMGTYIVAIIPFILVSRFITSLVTDAPITAVEQKQTNLTARLFLFFSILGSIVFIFQQLESAQH